MQLDIVFPATIEKATLKLDKPDEFKRYLSGLSGRVTVAVRKYKTTRTNRQNKWYWSCVVGIPAEHYGYFPDEMHDAYKQMFLKYTPEGKPATTKSTRNLSTSEFCDYTERCRKWAAEQGFNIPDPE